MRIRKNAERVAEKKSYLICQLNRAPWDDDSFLTKGAWDKYLSVNGSSSDSRPPSDRYSGESMDILDECAEKTPPRSEQKKDDELVAINDGDKNEIIERFTEARIEIERALSFSLPPLCGKVAVPVGTASVLPKKRGRPKKSKHRNNGNGKSTDDDYHYYSVFGPGWSKRRGGTKFNPAPQLGNGNGIYTPGCSSDTRENMISISDSENDVMDDDENEDTIMSKNNNAPVTQSAFNGALATDEELDYIDDEDWYGGGGARKPIKARSLKSLM